MRDVQIYKRGQIYWRKDSDRGENIPGIISKSRPVLIVSNDVGLSCSNIATVCPLTTSGRRNPLCTQVKLIMNGVDNWILCEQVYTCNLSELSNYIGTVGPHVMEQVETALKYTLGMIELPKSFHSSDVEDITEDELGEATNENITKSESDTIANGTRARVRTRWFDENKLQLCIDYAEHRKGKISEETLLSVWGFSNIQSLASSVRRFKKQLGV